MQRTIKLWQMTLILGALAACGARGGSTGFTDASVDDAPQGDVVIPADAPVTPTDVPSVPDIPAAPDVPMTSDVPVVPDVPMTPDVPSTPDVPAVRDVPLSTCALPGTYLADLGAVGMIYFSLRDGGQWRFAPSSAELETSTMGGTWERSGDRLSIVEATRSVTNCTTTQTGVYVFTFSPDCRTLSLTVDADPCTLRSVLLDGRSMTRL